MSCRFWTMLVSIPIFRKRFEAIQPVKCQFCTSSQFRRSKLRESDALRLALLEYPVRCLRCSQRQFVPFVLAALSLSSSARHPRMPGANESWEAWTRGTHPKGGGYEVVPAAAPAQHRQTETPEDSRNVW